MGQHKHSFEFFGPYGPGALMVLLPMACYALALGCSRESCFQAFPSVMLPTVSISPEWLFSTDGLLVFCGWFFGIVLLHLMLPGKRAQGVVLPNGNRLTYKLNSFTVFLVSYGACVYFGFFSKQLPLNLGWVYDNFLPLLTASILFSSLLAVYLYVSSFKQGALLGSHGNTGYAVYDFWMGRELNPRLGGFDFKEFCELYPGLIGWAVLNLAFAHKQYTELGYVTNAVLLVNAFHLYYVVDALWNEKAILTTMDITTDGFGFMLAFGDLSIVPFTYTTTTRFLVDFPRDLSLPALVGVIAVKLLGYWIFRGANGQKDAFRTNPDAPAVRHLKTLKTERGTQLIVSGWWGTSRHINYFGDWIMGLAWCMPAGLDGLAAVIPYYYAIYFAILLMHRERRDDASCRLKYGKDWDKYCALVKYRIVPYVY